LRSNRVFSANIGDRAQYRSFEVFSKIINTIADLDVDMDAMVRSEKKNESNDEIDDDSSCFDSYEA
jgi:hypothetical protein